MLVKLPTSVDLDALAAACTGRPKGSLFSLGGQPFEDFTSLCAGANVLVTGAAGFIARATLPHVIQAGPRILHLLDSSENGLADLARDLAAHRSLRPETELRISLADITSPLLPRAIAAGGAPNLVLHFAAAKHVRSERDVVSALRILDVNVHGTQQLLDILATLPNPPRVFAVSTDKAVRPTSMMGASKALMESLLWEYPGEATSTRFANVLFSTGSLTESWVNRLAAGDPLSAPLDTLRYFVSAQEAGRLCSHAIAAPPKTVTIPAPDCVKLVQLTELAERFLHQFSLLATRFPLADWEQGTVPTSPDAYLPSSYPLVCTPRDTSGEKQYEEFRDPSEETVALTGDLVVISEPASLEATMLLTHLEDWLAKPAMSVTLSDLGGLLRTVVPSFSHDNQPRPGLDSRI